MVPRWQRNTVRLRGCAPRVRRGARSRFGSRAISCAATARGGGRSSPPGRPGSPRTRSPPARSRGALRPAGAMPRFASTTSAAGSSRPRCSAPARCCSSDVAGSTPVALVYVGLAIGVAIAAPLQTELSGTEIPEAQDVLDLWPARILAIARQLARDARRRRRRARDVPRAPARERLDPRGDRRRGDRKRPRRARRRRASARGRARRRAPLRRVRRPVAAREATPRRARRPPRARSTPRRSRRGRPHARLATREQPHPSERVEHHQPEHRELRLERGSPALEHRHSAIVRDREACDVPDHERRDLHVPDRLGRHDREVRREVDRPEEIPATPERVGDQRDDELALDQERA